MSSEIDHDQLLRNVAVITDPKRKTVVQRSGIGAESASNVISSSEKVQLSDLTCVLSRSKRHSTIKKQLSSVQDNRRLVPEPLPKHVHTQIQRSIAYDATKKDVSKWCDTVRENRKADQLVFPINEIPIQTPSLGDWLETTTPQSSLEKEVKALLEAGGHVIPKGEILTTAEQDALKMLNAEEAEERISELRKYRALVSYRAAKFHRQKKIKSKRYHRIAKKSKDKALKSEMEELAKQDPEQYLEMLRKLEKERAEERMSQKHRGGSKFAKKKMIYAKFDEKARQDIQEMIQRNKQLTEKVHVEQSSSDGSDNDAVDNITVSSSLKSNPWFKMTSSASNLGADEKPGKINRLEPTARPKETEEGLESNVSEENVEDIKTLKKKKQVKSKQTAKRSKETSELPNNKTANHMTDDVVKEVVDESTIDEIFDQGQVQMLENRRISEEKCIRKLAEAQDRREKKRIERYEQKKQKRTDTMNEKLSMPKESLKRRKAFEDFEDDKLSDDDQEEEINSDDHISVVEAYQSTESSLTDFSQSSKKQKISQPAENLSALLNEADAIETIKKPAVVKTAFDRSSDQKLTIAEAFADDDVIAEFESEKAAIEERDKPKDIDLTLPGWGTWGGTDIKPNKKKKFILKAPPGPPRTDSNLKHVIISEKMDKAVSKYQVKQLPFPFINVAEYENSLKHPLGKTWNPEIAFKELTKPKIVTKAGQIIQPINEEHLLKKKKKRKNYRELLNDAFCGGISNICFRWAADDILACTCSQDLCLDNFNNYKFFPILDNLLKRSYFKYFRVNLKRRCPFWEDDRSCVTKNCHVDECPPDALPEGIINDPNATPSVKSHKKRKSKYSKQAQETDSCIDDNAGGMGHVDHTISDEDRAAFSKWQRFDDADDDKFCEIEDDNSPNNSYVDLSLNPERFTGYTGDSTMRVWNSIYTENCFPKNSAYVDILSKGTQERSRGECLEHRTFYRLMSGLHTSITIDIFANYPVQKPGKGFLGASKVEFAPNLEYFRQRFDPDKYPEVVERLSNLYFAFIVELRALAKVAPYLEKELFYTGNEQEDTDTRAAVSLLLENIRTFPSHFDESRLFQGDPVKAHKLKNEFRSHFLNISRIMDCVGCDSCRLWGKLQIQGMGTALKILFSGHDIGPDSTIAQSQQHHRHGHFQLRRNEVVALFQAIGRLSDSIQHLQQFRKVL